VSARAERLGHGQPREEMSARSTTCNNGVHGWEFPFQIRGVTRTRIAISLRGAGSSTPCR
jgi:hypothetical protein